MADLDPRTAAAARILSDMVEKALIYRSTGKTSGPSHSKTYDDSLAEGRKLLDELGEHPALAGPAAVRGARKATGWGDKLVKQTSDARTGFKALTTGSVTVPSLTSGVVQVPDRATSLLQVVPAEPLTGTDQFSYLKETVRTHAAAPVAVGAVKPTSTYTVERVDGTVVTVAHLSEAIPRQTLADAALLRDYVEGSLREGLSLAVENQILNGSGVAPNLTGIANTAGVSVQAWDTDILTTTRKAISTMENNNVEPSFFILAPADWETVELLQENSGNYFLGGPVDRARRRLWGVPVVTTTAQTAGTGYLVNVASLTLREREAVRVDWSENLGSEWSQNLIRWRCETRVGFGVTRPTAGVVEVDTSAAV